MLLTMCDVLLSMAASHFPTCVEALKSIPVTIFEIQGFQLKNKNNKDNKKNLRN